MCVRPEPTALRGLEVEGNDCRRNVRNAADSVCNAVCGAVVEHSLRAAMKRAAREQHGALGLAVGDDIRDIFERRAFETAVAALENIEREVRETQPAPLLLELLGGGGVDVEMHGAQLVRPQRASVLHCARRRHVELADEHEHDVALQDGGFGGCCGTRLELLLLRDVLPMQADEPVVHRWPDHCDDPCAFGELRHKQDADDGEREGPANALTTRRLAIGVVATSSDA